MSRAEPNTNFQDQNSILSANPKKAKTKTKFRMQIILSDGTPHRSHLGQTIMVMISNMGWILKIMTLFIGKKTGFDTEVGTQKSVRIWKFWLPSFSFSL